MGALLIWSTEPKEKSEEAQHHVQLEAEGQEQVQADEQPISPEQQLDEQPVSQVEQPLPISQEQAKLIEQHVREEEQPQQEVIMKWEFNYSASCFDLIIACLH